MIPTMFHLGQEVLHVNTGNVYVITGVPDNSYRLEYCNESYYTYRANFGGVIRLLRRKSEMEDGRFIPYEPGINHDNA